MLRRPHWLILAAVVAACAAPHPPRDTAEPDPRDRAAPGEERLRVVVMADLNSSYGSTEYDPEVGHAVRRSVREWRPDLVLIAGDMVAGQRPGLDDRRVLAMWAAFDSVVAAPLRRAGIPLAFTLGNHDASGHPGHERDRLGQGPRRLLGSDVPPAKTVTILELFPARDSLSERTFQVRGDTFTPVVDLTRSVEAPPTPGAP